MTVRILEGHVLARLGEMESQSVHCVVTSPPYYCLRDYGVEGQIGLEETPAAFLDALWAVFDEVKRVLRPDGLCFVNIGDSYAGSGKGPTGHTGIGDQQLRQGFVAAPEQHGDAIRPKMTAALGVLGAVPLWGYPGLKGKDLMLIPQRFAIGMQERGWWVRSEIVWSKTSPMPESVRDRPTSAWEPIWMFAKSARYFYDQEAVRQPNTAGTLRRFENNMAYSGAGAKTTDLGLGVKNNGSFKAALKDGFVPGGASLRNVWHLGPDPFREAHFATFVPEVPRRCILAGTSGRGCCPMCGAPWVRRVDRRHVNPGNRSTNGTKYTGAKHRPGGSAEYAVRLETRTETLGWEPSCGCPPADPVPCTVLDPFGGAGTTGLVADRLGRDSVLIELNPEYAAMARHRIAGDAPMFTGEVVS